MNDKPQTPKSLEDAQKKSESKQLDRELEDTFPASDPPAITTPHTKEEKPKKE